MTPNNLQSIAVELFGRRGWVIDLAAALKIHRATVSRYIHGQLPIPGPVEISLDGWLREYKENGTLPKNSRKNNLRQPTPLAIKQLRWLENALLCQSDDCIIWPFYKLKGGYGSTTKLQDGKTYLAHRWICERIHGPPPTSKHEAAHSCGNGHLACANPKHVSWKTASQNRLDKRNHGTQSLVGGRKMTPVLIRKIRELAGKLTQREIAVKFGITQSNVSTIVSRKTWNWSGM
jgi:plasmid maintenance system antidote protein VapI